MATRISVVQNPHAQFTAWMCKHASKTAQTAESEGHVVLCDAALAVKNGAELLNDDTRQPIEPAKITLGNKVKKAAAGK